MKHRGCIAGIVLIAAACTVLNFGPQFARNPVVFLALWGLAVAAYLPIAGRTLQRPGTLPTWCRGRGLLLVALLIRLPSLPAAPYLSDDVYRYLWEGRVQRAGYSPYEYAPESAELAHLRDDSVFPKINHKEVPAAYPPVAQWIFRLIPDNLWLFKSFVLAAELALILTLGKLLRRLRKPEVWATMYVLHPLCLLEFSGSAHFDVFALLAMFVAFLACRRSELAAAILTGAAAMVKPTALAPGASLVRRGRWLPALAVAATMGAALLPYLGEDEREHLTRGILQYADHWEFNGLAYPAAREGLAAAKEWLEASEPESLRDLGYAIHPTKHARRGLLLVFVTAAAWIVWRFGKRPTLMTLALLTAFLATTPTVYPWYVLWLIPFLALHHHPALLVLTLTAAVAHVVQLQRFQSGLWQEVLWVRLVHWGPAVLLALSLVWRSVKRSRQPPQD